MDKKIKRRWLRALRSGKYTQCQGSLHLKDDGFCCLGVLCDVLKKDFKNIDWKDTGNENCSIFDENGVLPDKIVIRAGLKDSNPEVIISEYGSNVSLSLAELNDEGKTFKEIADIIAKQL